MKLKMLVVAAVGCLVMPAITHAQATDTTKMTMSSGNNPAANEAAARDSITRDAGMGPQTEGCPLGCPTSKGAAGLTAVQFLALQQELRDRKCSSGIRVTGVLDGPTRRGIAGCAKRYGVANNAAALLAALNVGFTAAELGSSGP
ncbi:MAG TPA: hypothetical protein VM099_13070 [Gemmatimonadaceae bacterium]|nr:hypothetical protein [Gemmatimonadaceae bacterium]